MSDKDAVRPFLPHGLSAALDEPDTGPYKDNAAFLLELEALSTLQVCVFKLSQEAGQRILSYSSDDFGNSSGPGVQAAVASLPALTAWVERLSKRVEARSCLPMVDESLPPRFHRVCEVYELSSIDRKLLAALLMQRISHAFASIKLGGQVTYGGGGVYGNGAKPGVTLSHVLHIALSDIATFQKPERKHVKQGVVLPATQLLGEVPALQPEAVLLLLALPLNASQLFNIEKSDLMRVLREEPGFEAKPEKEPARPPQPVLPPTGPTASLYSLLQMEVAAESGVPPAGTAVADAGGAETAEVNEGVRVGAASAAGMAATGAEAVVPLFGKLATSGLDGRGLAGHGLAGALGVSEARGASVVAAEDAAGGEGGESSIGKGEDGGTKEAGKGAASTAEGDAAEAEEEEEPLTEAPRRTGKYENDLEYLQDMFQLVKLRSDVARVKRLIEERGQQNAGQRASAASDGEASDDDQPPMHMDDGYWGVDDYAYEMEAMARTRFGRNLRHEASKQARHESKRARKLHLKAERLQERIHARLQSMADGGTRLPRLERLASALGLEPFEKNVVVAMIGQAIAPRSMGLMGGGGGGGHSPSKTMQVEVLLRCFSSTLQQQIKNRRHFYKSAVLVREGILVLHGDELGADLTQTLAEIDRRMLDFVVGLDTEFSELMEGSHLYTPTVCVDEVVLAESKKKLVLDTVKHFDQYVAASKELELHKTLAYGRGMVLLFYGPSGTGKTMMANGLAAMIQKKVLMINFPQLGTNAAGAILKLVFREAKIHDAVLFFDECESIFMDRTKGNLQVNTVLTELERHEGLCVLATNRPMDLDEAMHRRITLAIEFTKPDLLLRERIWRSMAPPKLTLADDIDYMALARKYELPGGFIKNAWITALSLSVAREGSRPTVTQADLHAGASHQLRGRLAMSNFDRGVVPQQGLESVILPPELKDKLKQIVNYSKAQAVLFGQWGFQQQHGRAQGISALFHGPPGTGKTMAAEAIGFDVGRPLLVVNCAQLIDKYVGESAKNIEAVFTEAKAQDAVLVFDEAEGRPRGIRPDATTHCPGPNTAP